MKSLFACLLLLLPPLAWCQTPAPAYAADQQNGQVMPQQAPSQAPQQDSPVRRQMRDLEAAINRVQQEQQSTFQHFQLIQELRRNAQQANDTAPMPQYSSAGSMGTVPNYDDVQRAREQRLAQIQQYTDDMNALYARYRELDTRKRALLDQLDRLTQMQRGAQPR